MDQKEGDYCSVDVDKVDMVKYPFLQTLPWWNVTVEQGDCLYVPHGLVITDKFSCQFYYIDIVDKAHKRVPQTICLV